MAGAAHAAPVFSQPHALLEGKPVLRQFELCKRDWPSLRLLAHAGICAESHTDAGAMGRAAPLNGRMSQEASYGAYAVDTVGTRPPKE